MSDDIRPVDQNEGDHMLDMEAVETEPDPWQIEVDEGPAADEAKQDEQTEEVVEAAESEKAETVKEWDGNPASLPPELQPIHKQMVQGMNRKFQELAVERKESDELRRQYEEKLESLGKQVQPNEDPPPKLDTSSEDAYQRSVQELISWNVRQATQEVEAKSQSAIQEVMTKQQAMEQAKQQADFDNWCERIEKSDGYTEAIGRRMVDLSRDNPAWGDANSSEAKMNALFSYALMESQSQQFAASEQERKATAGQRAVSRPGAAKKSAPGPTRKYAESFDDAFQQMFEEAQSEHGLA